MGFFRCPINHELIDTGIEQELSFMFGTRKGNLGIGADSDRSVDSDLLI